MIRAALPTMRAQGGGVIVNIASAAGRVPGLPVNWAYCASKHALCSLSDSLSGEVQPFGIRVVSIEPGFFATSNLANATRPTPGSPYEELEAMIFVVAGSCVIRLRDREPERARPFRMWAGKPLAVAGMAVFSVLGSAPA